MRACAAESMASISGCTFCRDCLLPRDFLLTAHPGFSDLALMRTMRAASTGGKELKTVATACRETVVY